MHDRTLTELAADLAAKRVSAVELTKHFLARIERYDDALNAFVTVTAEQALKQAQAADQRRARGDAAPLTGIPLAHKDIFCTAGVKTTCGSKMLDDFVAPYDATVVERFADAGAVMLGKTNMDEFAMGSSNETSYYGPVHNPWDLSLVPGGSSGGSAAAVAARIAAGRDGNRHRRLDSPARSAVRNHRHQADVRPRVALRDDRVRVEPRSGRRADADGGRRRAAARGDRGSRRTRLDSRSTSPCRATREIIDEPWERVTIGVPESFFDAGLDPEVASTIRAALKEYEKLGAKLKSVKLDYIHLSVPAYYVVAPAEASSNLSRFDGVRFGHRASDAIREDLTTFYMRNRGEGFGAEVKRRIMTGTYVLSAGYFDAYYLQAQKVRKLISDDFARAFREVDVVAGPTSPSPAFGIGAQDEQPDRRCT